MGILFENVTYAYHAGSLLAHIALESVCLHIETGRFVAVLGAAGSGKSTLLQHMNGIVHPTFGKLRILDVDVYAGEPIHRPSRLRKRVGLVFQFPEQQLFAETVEEELCFGPLNFGATQEEALAAAREALAAIGMDASIMERHPYELSGGQMRKVAIAAVLAAKPDILVLDEPTASLDPASREELLTLLSRMCQEQGKTIIMVTHRLEEVLPHTDEYIVMQEGRAVFHGQLSGLEEMATVFTNNGISLPGALLFMHELRSRFRIEQDSRQLLDHCVETLHPRACQAEDIADWICSWIAERPNRN